MFRNILNFIKKAVFQPEIRLKANFPWTFGKMAKSYAVATTIYFIGSFVPVVLFLGGMFVMEHTNPRLLMRIIIDANGQPNMSVVVATVIVSFITGFGSELLYIRKVFHKDGISMRQAVGLNLDTLGGSWWAAIWRALVAFALVLGLGQLLDYLPLPKPVDPAVQFALGLHTGGLVAFGLLAVVLAPMVEELVFRGFLFNVLRTSFRQGKLAKLLRTERAADYAAITLSAAVFAAMHMNLYGFPGLFLMGLVLASLYRRSGSLICSMMLHALNNAVCFVVLVLPMIH